MAATGGASGNPVTFTIDGASTAGACSIAGAVVSFTGVGTCIIDANQAGNASYAAAPQVQQPVTVSKGAQTITPTTTAPASATIGGATYTPAATASSGLAVAITIDASSSSVCKITAGVVSYQATGTCKVDFNQAGNGNYNAAPQVQQSIAVGLTSQTITPTSTAPASATVGGTTYTPTATASSGLTVAITIDATSSSVCKITAGVVSYQTTGTCLVDFNQAGNGTYAAAPQVQQSITVSKAPRRSPSPRRPRPVPWWAAPPTRRRPPPPRASPWPSPSTPRPPSVCSITAGAVSFQAAGTCTLDANQAGNANYNAATQAQQSFTVGKGAQTVTFTSTAPAGAVVGGATYTPAATATSGLAVTITVDASASAVCAITAGVVSFRWWAPALLDANQAGNANYNAAPQAQQSFAVGKGAQTVTFTSTAPAGAVVGGATYTPAATASSGLAVTITVDASASAVCSITAGASASRRRAPAPSTPTRPATPTTTPHPGPAVLHRGQGRPDRHLHLDRPGLERSSAAPPTRRRPPPPRAWP